ncbi:MAG: hypothetical protein C0614_10730 [Desulfuromonas sp.]|nr:MAG: hypothetical protein C0614_10730 [Desulfuromonas sp.]
MKTVFVLGIARSGSTLLGRMLDTHSKILCVGEMMRIGQALESQRICSCGALVDQCPFWKEQLPLLNQEASNLNYRKFTPRLYDTIAQRAGKDLVVDLSKTLVWRAMHWPPNWRWIGKKDFGFIFLLRDSRGVTASSIRDGKSFQESIRTHFKWMRRFCRFYDRFRQRTLVVRYEDLCADPKKQLEIVCRFLGLEFEDACLDPVRKEHHLVHCSKSNYMKNQSKIQQDERWKNELTKGQVTQVEAEMRNIPFLKESYL